MLINKSKIIFFTSLPIKKTIFCLIVLALSQFIGQSECLIQTVDKRNVKVMKIADKGGQKVKIDKKKNIYVLNLNKHDITILGSKFNVIRRIGGWGQGPAEFRNPFDFDIDLSDRVWVIDYFNKRIQVLSKNGDYMKDIPKNGSIRSIVCLSNGEVCVNNSENNSLFSSIDIKTDKLESYGRSKKYPWIISVIDEIYSKEGKKRSMYNPSYIRLLNEAWIRTDGSNNIYLLYMFAPTLRKYDPNKRLVFDIKIKTKGIDSLLVKVQQSVKENIAKGVIGSSFVFQDFFVSPYSGKIYILSSNPGMLVFDREGHIIEELDFIDEKTNQPIQFSGICYFNKDQWIGVNAQGAYIIKIEDESKEYWKKGANILKFQTTK